MRSPTKLLIVPLLAAALLGQACGRTEPVQSAEDTSTTETTSSASTAATTSTTVAEQPSTYVIQPGDSLGAIAAAYGLGADELATYNNLDDPDRIAAGQQLLIPPGATSTTTIPTTAPPPPPETESTEVAPTTAATGDG